jgi:hypothetical protein
MGDRRGAYRILWGDLSERDHLEDLGLDRRIILKWILRSKIGEWIGFIWLSIGKRVGLL